MQPKRILALIASLTIITTARAADEKFRDAPPPDAHRPTRIVYLCDASKSMKDKYAVFGPEINKAIQSLDPGQSFTIIFLVDGKAVPMNDKLLSASPENKRKAAEFIDKVTPAGVGDPIPGLRAAFAAKPERIYFATDGGFTNRDELLKEARALNNKEKRPVAINTIAVFDRGEEYEKLLKQIADESGGLFKFVSKADLER
jgi:hypothetical protein